MPLCMNNPKKIKRKFLKDQKSKSEIMKRLEREKSFYQRELHFYDKNMIEIELKRNKTKKDLEEYDFLVQQKRETIKALVFVINSMKGYI